MKKAVIVAVFAAACTAGTAFAAPPPQAIRGTIDKMEGPAVFIKQAQGPEVSVRLLDNANVFGVEAATLIELKPNDFIGVGATPQPDGSQKAILVTIFAESQRGTGEGFRPWDRPGSTMTNGTAESIVSTVDGRVVTVKYKGGEQKITVGADAKIRRYVPATRDDLKPGAKVSVPRPDEAPDGSLQTSRINVGIGDMAP